MNAARLSGIYDDIFDLDAHESIRHKRMDRQARAAQFAPFVALTGYEEAVSEKARITYNKIELSDDRKADIDAILQSCEGSGRRVRITYFCPDKYKDGGSYLKAEGEIRHIDKISGRIILKEGLSIGAEDIFDIVPLDMHKNNEVL